MREHPPQVLLTNYMMLELLLTRVRERSIRDAIYENLRFLVFDELHTYRGRQGADVAMLIRRIRAAVRRPYLHRHVGHDGLGRQHSSQREAGRRGGDDAFRAAFAPEQVINETLARSFLFSRTAPRAPARANRYRGITSPTRRRTA